MVRKYSLFPIPRPAVSPACPCGGCGTGKKSVSSSPRSSAASVSTIQCGCYSYQDLLALLVVSVLRTERNMSLQKIRRVVTHLRARGYQAPLRELKFATVGREIYFQHPDGRWEGDLRPDQIVIVEVILLDPLRLRIDRAVARPAQDAGRVEKRRGVHASAPVFAGTRIRVATVQRYLQQGYRAEAILEAFPDLSLADVEEARRQLAVSELVRFPA